MPTPPTPLALRIKRLSLDPQKQEELVNEIKKCTPEQMKLFVQLLNEHDRDCLKLLDEKLKESQSVRQYVGTEMKSDLPPAELRVEDIQAFARDIFASPENFVLFTTIATDELLKAVQDVVLQLVPEFKKDEIEEFFRQIRVQKKNLQDREQVAYKQALIKQIRKREQQIAEMDRVIAEVENELQTQNK